MSIFPSRVHWHRWALSPWFNTIVTVLIILVGTFGALYTDEIRSAFPLHLGRGPIIWHAVLGHHDHHRIALFWSPASSR